MGNTGLEEAQAGIKSAGGNIDNLRYADDTTFMAECEEELKSPLMKVKEESEKAGLKLNIEKVKIMVSGPITSCQIGGGTVKQWQSLFIFFGSNFPGLLQISAAMKLRHLLLGRKAYDQPRHHIKKQRITLLTKVCLVKAMVFPVFMYGWENLTIKKVENQRIEKINSEYPLGVLILNLKLQYISGHLMQISDWLERILMLGKIEGRRKRQQQRMRW